MVMMALLDSVGERIRARREKLGMTQRDLASALQVSAQAVSKWERGENAPDVGVLPHLGRLLGVSLDWLLGSHSPGTGVNGTNGTDEPDVIEVTVFFADLPGYLRQLTDLSVRDGATWLNGRLYQLTEAVLRHDGIPVKYLGDALLAFFTGTRHRDRAVKAALLARRTMGPRQVWLGLNSGFVYFGQIGHPDYARLDIIGEAVNNAALAEGWAKQAASGIAVTPSVLDGLTEPVETVERVEQRRGDLPEPFVYLGLKAD